MTAFMTYDQWVTTPPEPYYDDDEVDYPNDDDDDEDEDEDLEDDDELVPVEAYDQIRSAP